MGSSEVQGGGAGAACGRPGMRGGGAGAGLVGGNEIGEVRTHRTLNVVLQN